MSTDAVAVLGFVALFALMLLRVPVGMAMGLVGVTGFGSMVGLEPALKLIAQTSMRTVTDYTFGVIPMFLLMGQFVSNSGMSRELFDAAGKFVGHLRGGLGLATVAACGGFAAICGSSVATAATFSTVAYPEMRRAGYPQSFSTGVIAAGGTLGAMLPPSTVLAVYGIITEQDIGKLFVAGIIPGILAAFMYMMTIAILLGDLVDGMRRRHPMREPQCHRLVLCSGGGRRREQGGEPRSQTRARHEVPSRPRRDLRGPAHLVVVATVGFAPPLVNAALVQPTYWCKTIAVRTAAACRFWAERPLPKARDENEREARLPHRECWAPAMKNGLGTNLQPKPPPT